MKLPAAVRQCPLYAFRTQLYGPALCCRAEMGSVDYGPIDYQDLYYYSAPKRNVLASLALPYQRFACSLTTARA